MSRITVAVTGHRPSKLGGYGDKQHNQLIQFARDVLVEEELFIPSDDYYMVLSGMAQGWDQAIVTVTSQLSISWTAVLPCLHQDTLWGETAQAEYRRLLELADEVVTVSDHNYTPNVMPKRNHYMVDRLTGPVDYLLALWNGQRDGGTAECVRYAEKKKVKVVNVWDRWRDFLKKRDL